MIIKGPEEIPEGLIVSVLPEEMIDQIFFYLEPHHLKVAGLVNKFFSRISKTSALWRELIKNYFPYLLKTPEIRISNYQELFTKTYRHYFKIYQEDCRKNYWKENTSLFLSALAGDISKLKSAKDLDEEHRRWLYAFSTMLGSVRAAEMLIELWTNLLGTYYRLLETPKYILLDLAVRSGRFDRVEWIFDLRKDTWGLANEAGETEQAFKLAMRLAAKLGYLQTLVEMHRLKTNGIVWSNTLNYYAPDNQLLIDIFNKGDCHFDVMEWIENTIGAILLNCECLLNKALSDQDLRILEWLFTKFNISSERKTRLFEEAIKKGYIKVILWMIERAKSDNQSIDADKSLQVAIDNQQPVSIEWLLRNTNLSPVAKGVEFTLAASLDCPSLVGIFVKCSGSDIPVFYKKKAFRFALEKKYNEIVRLLLVYASEQDKGNALIKFVKRKEIDNVRYVLENASENIPAFHWESAIKSSIKIWRIDIFEILLSKVGNKISTLGKENIIREAVIQCQPAILKHFLTKENNVLTPALKKELFLVIKSAIQAGQNHFDSFLDILYPSELHQRKSADFSLGNTMRSFVNAHSILLGILGGVIAASCAYIFAVSTLPIWGVGLLAANLLIATVEIRSFLFHKAEKEISEDAKEKSSFVSLSEQSQAYRDGIFAGRSWTAYWRSSLSTEDWKHPVIFGAGMKHTYNNEETFQYLEKKLQKLTRNASCKR